jgi:hypothetical protein
MSHNNVFLNSKYASSFSPQVIPGLALWLDAADRSTFTFSSGSNISQWNDKSGNGRNAIAETSPILSNSGVYFSGSSSFNTTYTALPTIESIFIVYNLSSSPGYFTNLIGPSASSGRAISLSDSAPYFLTWDRWGGGGGAFGPGASVSDISFNTRTLTTGLYNGTGTISLNGSNQSAGSTGSFSGSGTTTRIGRGAGVGGIVGFLFEVIIFDTFVTTSQRQQVEGYLAWKWGLVGNLPTAHPYRTAPIFTRPFNPLDIAGCALWLDAADYRTFTFSSGSNVSEWRDKSGLGQILSSQTATGAVASNFNGRASLYFGRAPWYRTTGFALSNTQGTAWFTVYATTGNISTSGSILLVGGSNIERFIRQDVANQAQISTFHPPVQRITSDAGALNTPALYNFVDTPSALTVFKNGSQIFNANTAVTYATNTNQTLQIGYYNDYLLGHIFELLIYDSPLSTAQRQQVEVYLAEKWGLRSSLSTSNALRLYPALSPVFNPTLVSNCTLWLDAADQATMTLSGSSVTAWRDKSGNGYNATVTSGANAPILSGNSIQFRAASSQSLDIAQGFGTSLVDTTLILFFVGQRVAASGFHFFLSGATTDNNRVMQTGFFNDNMSLNIYGTEFNVAIPAYSASAEPTRIYSYALNTATAEQVMNGTTLQSTAGTYRLAGFLGPQLGRRYSSVNIVYHSFNISEMIGFAPIISVAQRQAVEGYLAWKWGLVGNLPSAHPYKSIKP